ncbi:unnamed protein product [Peronospora belbahrii]|uniref:Little elongation complex subunit 2 C-terminal domain-containing protein n=1 Tax=Peronospora belbahrii TaxID=622444 RepID=A0AAU9KNP2_9STRA|nr:unnamed protein product [Peronospora belbahrii]
MTMDMTSASTAFAVPRQLLLGHKRRAIACHDPKSSSFFTADDFDTYSIRGDGFESQLYGELETHRRTLVTTAKPLQWKHKSSMTIDMTKKRKHLMQLLFEAIQMKRIQAPEKLLAVFDNVRRRISRISVAEHDQYLQLQRSIYQAQQRGLPEELALSEDEAKQWQQMKKYAETEQVEFCSLMTRGLAAEAAFYETHVPLFAASWYNAMLTQCWNDIYRLYTRWFHPCMEIELPSRRVLNSSTSDLIKAKEVATRGICCTIDLTKLAAGQPLKSMTDESDGLALDAALPRHVISADAQAKQLMELYDCDIAISSSTLVTLFDSNTSSHFGHVQALSKAVVKKKRIYLDRPLPGSSPRTREKVAEAGRAALFSRFEVESVLEGSTGGRTVYFIWQLDEKRILVRSTTHVHMITPTLSPSADMPQDEQHKKEGTVPLSVFVKPDYHLLGVEEQLTTSERCRFWFHSWLRGGSTVLVVRVNPTKDTVSSWKTYLPASLIFGDKKDQCVPLELFDPSSKFKWLSMLFTGLVDLPVGNYLLRPKDACRPSTFEKRSSAIEVLMATAEPVAETGAIDLYSFMPKTRADGVATSSNATSVLPAWTLYDRIPYTFQTGMYCVPFFLDGVCPNVSQDETCDYIHLRLSEQRGSKELMKAKRWSFDHYTVMLKKASTHTKPHVWSRPRRALLKYAFCGEDKAPPVPLTASDLYTRLHCLKCSDECSLPHLTLHQILERLADDIRRKERGKRRVQKSEYRKQHK